MCEFQTAVCVAKAVEIRELRRKKNELETDCISHIREYQRLAKKTNNWYTFMRLA